MATARAIRMFVACAGLLYAGCGDDADAAPKQTRSVTDALTRGMSFDDGTVRLGNIGDPTTDSVRVSSARSQLRLSPGQAMLLPLEVESSAEDEAIDAVLLQFSGGESHIEVMEEAELEQEALALMLDFMVEPDVCEGLCARTFELTMVQAVRTADGEVSEQVEREVVLDCRDAGDPALCSEPYDAGAVADATSEDAGPAGDAADPATADITQLTAALSEGLSSAHDALCTSCSDPERIPCYAIVPLGAIACIEGALTEATGTVELAEALQDLVAQVEAAAADCSACELEACAPPLLQDALADFPADAQTAVSACFDR